MLAKIVSIYFWNVELPSFQLNGILTNSNKPKGVVTAVLGMTSGDTGICRYAFEDHF